VAIGRLASGPHPRDAQFGVTPAVPMDRDSFVALSRSSSFLPVSACFNATLSVSAVARCYGLRLQRVAARESGREGSHPDRRATEGLCLARLAREGAPALPAGEEVRFVPIIATDGEALPPATTAVPAGSVEIELDFFKEDYRLSKSTRIVVDFGSNIGIRTAYFVTPNDSLRVYAYEPVPANVSRAKLTRRAACAGPATRLCHARAGCCAPG
jgi:hypothetical protein